MIPDYNRDFMEGQMVAEERKNLYEAVLETRPRVAVEVGTWKGGGSTYITACALHEIGSGILYTTEIDPVLHEHALKLYSETLSLLSPHVRLLLGDSRNVLRDVLSLEKNIDFLTLDGKEDPVQTVEEYNLIEPYMPGGATLFCHDWNISKMSLLKPILEKSVFWKLVNLINVGPTGAAIWRKTEKHN